MSNFLELLAIYKWAILAGSVCAAALSILGCHLAARDKAMQTLCVGQGASLGGLLGLALLHALALSELWLRAGPIASAALFSVLTYVISERIIDKRQSSRNSYLSSLFAALLATGYLVTALIPQLENHMTQVFFGDLATLSNYDSLAAVVLGSFVFAILVRRWRTFSAQSFNAAIFGEVVFQRRNLLDDRAFNALALVMLSFCVQFLGFLFTVSCLFLPTVLSSGVSARGLRNHFVFSGGLAASSTAIGFITSLLYSRVPTVPAIVLVMIVIGGLSVFLDRARMAKERSLLPGTRA